MSHRIPKPVIFLAFANDIGDGNRYLRQLRNEAEQLHELLDRGDARWQVVMRQNASLDNILDVFQDPRYKHRIAIFHFGGHANSYQLLLESAQGKAVAADAGGLAVFLAQQRGLQLVFLNGCSTREQVQGLLDAGVEAVIATDRKIRDEAAVDFAARFYRGLVGDDDLQTAFANAQGAVQADIGRTRDAYITGREMEGALADAWPWGLYPSDMPEETATWSLRRAADDPYFGLPPLPRRPLPARPFLGLSYFREKDAEIFFGRGHQIRELYDLVTDDTLSSNPIILLHGQSGVGKSSLLAAGLLPRLKQVCDVRYVRREEAGHDLTTALRRALRPKEPDLAKAWLAHEKTQRPLVIILDQVEEVYTRPGVDPAREMSEFLDALERIFGDDFKRWPKGKLILSFRKEWLAEIRDRLSQHDLPAPNEMFLKQLDRAGIIEAVTGPSQSPRLWARYGLVVGDELPVVIADDLRADRGSAIAPTLQIILTKLWENARGTPKVLDRDLYDGLRLQANFLDQLLGQQLAELGEKYPVENESGLTLDLLAYHTTDIGTARQRTWSDLEQNYAHQAAPLPGLIQACQDRYLLVDPAEDGFDRARETRLAHDALAPLVRRRFDESVAPGQQARRILEGRVIDIEMDNGGADLRPLDDADLEIVELGSGGMRCRTETEERLVETSRRAQKRRMRTRRIVRFASIGIAILVFSLLAYSLNLTSNSQRLLRRLASTLTSLTIEAQGLDYNPQRNLLLALEAVDLARDSGAPLSPQSPDILRNALSRVGGIIVRDASKEATALAISPYENRWLAIGNRKGELWLWDLTTQRPDTEPRSLPGHEAPISIALISRDNSGLVTADSSGINLVWNLDDLSAPPIRLEGPGQPLQKLVISPDGQWIAATGDQSRKVHLWYKETDQWIVSTLQIPASERPRKILALAISPDSRWLATGGAAGGVWLWPLTETGIRSEPEQLDQSQDTVSSIVFSADQHLYAGTQQGKAQVWDVSGDAPVSKRTFDDLRYVETIAVHSGWQAAFVGNRSGEIRLLRLQIDDPVTPITLSRGHGTGVTIALSPEGGRWMLTSDNAGTVRLWDLSFSISSNETGYTLHSTDLAGHGPGPTQVQLTPDDRWAFSLGADGIVRAWDLVDGSLAADAIKLGDIGQEFEASAVSSDGTLIAGADYASLRVWDITKEKPGIVFSDTITNSLSVLSFGKENQQLMIGYQFEDALEIVDIAKRERIASPYLGEGVAAVMNSQDGHWGVAGTWEGGIYLWDVAAQVLDEVDRLDTFISGVYISVKNRWLGAYAADDGSFRSWKFDPLSDATTLSHNCEVTDPHRSVWAVAFSKDRNWLALGGRTSDDHGFVQLCNLETNNSETLLVDDDAVDAIAVRSEEPMLATGHRSGLVNLWKRTASGFESTELTKPSLAPSALTEYTDLAPQTEAYNGPLYSLVFDGEDRLILLYGESHAEVWDLRKAQLEHRIDFRGLRRFDASDEWDTLAKMSSRGRWLITSEADQDFSGQVRLWPLTIEDRERIACDVVGRNFTKAEWEFYFVDQPYHRTCEKWPEHPTVNR